MRSAFGQGGILASVGTLAALAASIVAFSADTAMAQNAECARLQQAIAARRGSSGSQAAVERQRAELGRTRAYAGSLGCGNRKFLFFGSEPPPQCGEVTAQISRMEANLADLQARAGWRGRRSGRPLQRNAVTRSRQGPAMSSRLYLAA